MDESLQSEAKMVEELAELRRQVAALQAAQARSSATDARNRAISELISDYVLAAAVRPDGIVEPDRVANALQAIIGYVAGEPDTDGGWSQHFQDTTDYVFTLDASGRFRSANRAFCVASGYSPEELIGQSPLVLAAPGSRAAAEAALQAVLSGQSVAQMRLEVVAKDGRQLVVDVRGLTMMDQGQLVGTFHIARDITQWVRAEQQLAERAAQLEALRQLSLELATELDLDQLLYSIVSRAVELLGESKGGLYIYRPERDWLEWTTVIGSDLSPAGAVLRRGEGLSGQVLATGQPLIVDDYEHWQGRAVIYERFPFKAVVAVPVRWGQELLGVLDVLSDRPARFDQTDAELLSLFAAQAAIAIRNARLYQSLQRELAERERAEEAYRALVDHSIQGLVIARPDGIVFTNQSFADIIGIPVDQLLALPAEELVARIHPDDRERLRSLLAEWMAGRDAPLRTTFRAVRRDGTLRWAEMHASRVEFRDRPAVQAAVIDITDRMQAEETVERRNRELEVLNRAGQAFLSTLSLDDILAAALDQVRQVLGVTGCSAWLLDPASGELVCRQITDPAADVVRGWRLPPGVGLAGWVAQHGVSLNVPDAKADERHYQGVDDRTGLPLGAILTVPLQVKDRTIGVLQAVDTTTDRFTDTDLTVIESLASTAAGAVEQARLYQALYASQQHARSIIDSSLDMIISVDRQGQVVDFNRAAEASFGYQFDEIVGQDCGALLNDSAEATGLFDAVIEQGECVLEVTARRKSGELFPCLVSASALRDNAGGLVGAMGVARDVTEHRRAEAALLESNRRLADALARLQTTQEQVVQQERMAAVGQLAAGIAHDFNNIMAVVVLATQMSLRDPDLPPKVRDRLQTVDQQARHASHLVQQILDFSRSAVIRQEPVDLMPFLQEQVRLYRRTLPETIEIELIGGSDDYLVNADPGRLQQVIMNLALNARDAMPAGGSLRFALARIQDNGEWVQLKVSDTGTGIPLEALPRIFEPFYTTRAPLHSGLGLSQAHGIVAQHGGRIEIETQVGSGTTMIVYLPTLAGGRPAHPAVGESELPTGDGETILVVEDDPVIRTVLQESLEMLGYDVLTAADGREGLTVFNQSQDRIRLVLCDLVMPEIGGMAMCRQLKQVAPQVKTVVLTGYPLEDGGRELTTAGIEGWLRKPVDLVQLARVVARSIRRSAPGPEATLPGLR